jgi:hypothetical protein
VGCAGGGKPRNAKPSASARRAAVSATTPSTNASWVAWLERSQDLEARITAIETLLETVREALPQCFATIKQDLIEEFRAELADVRAEVSFMKALNKAQQEVGTVVTLPSKRTA